MRFFMIALTCTGFLFAANASGSPMTGVWVQTDGIDCKDVCVGRKMTNKPAPGTGNSCVSGEVRAGAANIKFIHGVWGSGSEFQGAVSGNSRTSRPKSECYGKNLKKEQKKDGDKTDITVGCYCA